MYSSVPDWLAARLRTVWPMLLGYAAAWLLLVGAPVVDGLRSTLGVEITDAQVALALGVALGALIYEAGQWLENRRGDGRLARLARGLGRLLLSIGVHVGPPTYGLPPAETQSEAEYDSSGQLRQIRSVTTWPPRP